MVKLENPKRKTCTSKTQNYWSKKLKYIKLNDLEHVCTFASGGYSHVSLVQLRGYPASAFALKAVQKHKIKDPAERENILREKTIMNKVQNDFIVKLHKTFKDDTYLYFLTEYLPGGELLNLGRLSESAARFYVACVVEAFGCLHKNNIAHNDLTPSNLVLDAEGYAKLIDFGFACQVAPGERLEDFSFGTIDYMPPEFHEGRDKAGDLWALGVLLYRLVTGVTPFEGDDGEDETTVRNILEGMDSVQFSRECFSEEAEDLIRKLCAFDPDSRLGYGNIQEIKDHRWFYGFDWSKLRSRKLTPPVVPKLDGVVDTHHFSSEVSDLDDDAEEDESDWDRDF